MDKLNIIERIKSIRRQKGISQESIAYDLGIDYSTYGKIERGHISLTVERLERIASILSVPLPEIYGWQDRHGASVQNVASGNTAPDHSPVIQQYQHELEKAKRELELLQQQLRDKEKIIALLENTKSASGE